MVLAYKNFVPEYWSSKLLKNYDATGVMAKCVNMEYESELKKGGDTVNIQNYGNIEVKTYNGSVVYETPTEDTQQLLLDQKDYWAFKVPDVDKVQANVNLINGYTGRAKVKIELSKDTFLLGKHSDVPAANTLGTTGSPIALTKDNIYGYMVDLSAILKDNNALKSADGTLPWVVINPTVEKLILKSPEFIAANNEAIVKETLINGAVGQIAGLNVLNCTNFVAISTKYYIMAGIKDAITFASQIEETEALRDQDSFNDLVRGLYVYGAKTVVPTAIAKIIATIA